MGTAVSYRVLGWLVETEQRSKATKMSEKWETVVSGKTKPAASKAKANGTKVSKKQEPKIYTMEDVLPASSVENMYQAAFNPTPASPKKDKKEKGNAKTKTKKKKKKKKK